MDWESEFQKRKTLSEENEACTMSMDDVQGSGLTMSRRPLQDINSEKYRFAWSTSGSFKSPEKRLDIVDDSQDSGVSFSPNHGIREKRLTKRIGSQLLSPSHGSKRESFGSIDEDMEVGEAYDEDDFELSPMPDAPPNISQNMLTSLLSGQIKNIPVDSENDFAEANKENFLIRKAIPRRIFNYNNDGTPPSSKVQAMELFKRPNVPCDLYSPAGHKRRKSASHGELLTPSGSLKSLPCEDESSGDESFDMLDHNVSWEAGPSIRSTKIFARSQSESAVSIMKAVEKIDSDAMLIGDGTKRYVLPILSRGKHSDLKEISGETLIKLMTGEFSHIVDHFDIIDCRYPYEFDGGHIKGAINIHTQKQLHERYMQNKSIAAATNEGSLNERHIILFHCEFSSQRAPDLCRFLREADRKCNTNSFPLLHYPELYVLHGGYKDFYEKHQEYCEPQTYLEMADPKHVEDFRKHKTKSKTDLVSVKSYGAIVPRTQRNFKKFVLK